LDKGKLAPRFLVGSCARQQWKFSGVIMCRCDGLQLININTLCAARVIFIKLAMGATMKSESDPFRALYEANHQRVRGLLARMVGPQEAEDLAQSVFAKAAKALPTFRGDAETSTWLHRIAASVASDWLRSRSTHESKLTVPLPDAPDQDMSAAATGADVDGQPTPEEELTRKDMHDCIRGEIGKLPEAHRTIFMLSALGGLTDDEIAETLGISPGNAKVRLHRARKEFRKIIEARCDFYRTELSCKPTSPDCCASSQPPGGSSSGH
jgi:RNA polymerase sigma-70 factor, ECF subfamily